MRQFNRPFLALFEGLESRRLMASTPFSGIPSPVPGTIEAENFDNGGEGVAYHDTTPGNQGGLYRSTDVDIEAANDNGGGLAVGHIVAGEWLMYTVNVAAAAAYQLDFRVCSGNSGGIFHLESDGTDITGPMTVPNSGWFNWVTVSKTGVNLSAGTHLFRLAFDAPNFGEVGMINNFVLSSPAIVSTPFSGTPVALPATIQAENFDNGGEGLAYHDTTSGNLGGLYRNTDVDISSSTDTGGGFAVGYTQAGEWLNYTVSNATAGNYILNARVAAATGFGGSFHFEIHGSTTTSTGTITFPATGGWNTWATVSSASVALPAGTFALRMVFDSANQGPGQDIGDVNWISATNATVITPFTFKPIAPSPLPRDEGSIASVSGKLYVFGGYDSNSYTSDSRADVYDPTTNTWTRLANMPEPLTHSQTVVDGSTIWFLGGFIGKETDGGSSHVWSYNTLTNTYTAGPAMPSGVGAVQTALVGRNIHVISGLSTVNGVFVNTTEHWVLNLDNLAAGWSNAATMPRPRNHGGAVAFNGQIWVVGGQNVKDELNGNSAAVDVYDPATDTWSQPGDLPAPRSHDANSVVLLNNTIYVFGGETTGQIVLSDTIAWNSAASAWQTQPAYALPLRRKAPNVAVVGNYVVAFGGANPNPVSNGWSGIIPPMSASPASLFSSSSITPLKKVGKIATIDIATTAKK